MRESDFQTRFKARNAIHGVFELKLIKCPSLDARPPFPYKRLAAHQERALISVSTESGLYHKISDSFIGIKTGARRFPSPKPFDCFFLRNVPAYVVICYYYPRKVQEYCYIPIGEYIAMKRNTSRRSLTYNEIRTIAEYITLGLSGSEDK